MRKIIIVIALIVGINSTGKAQDVGSLKVPLTNVISALNSKLRKINLTNDQKIKMNAVLLKVLKTYQTELAASTPARQRELWNTATRRELKGVLTEEHLKLLFGD